MTHILIPIADIEKEIQQCKTKITLLNSICSNDYYRLQGRQANLEHLLALSKQISLNEKDIEAKAYIYADRETDMHGEHHYYARVAYEQALKDLI